MNRHFENIIQNWNKAQKAGAILPCPKCGKMSVLADIGANALSRRADIMICSKCGSKEAFEDMCYRGSNEPYSDDYKEEFIKKWWLIRNVLGNTDAIKRGNEWEFQTTRTVIVTQEDIDEIMVLALEGGINYWCNEAEVAEDEYYGEFASEQISRGGSLKLHDSEIDGTCTLTVDKFIKGVQLAIAEGYGSDWLGDDARLDTGMMDGEAADIIVQMALFGEVMYG